MDIINPTKELKSSFMRLTYEEWLEIPEPVFFNFVAIQEENYWMFLEHADCLLDYSSQVTLIRVDEKLFKLDGKQRKIVWESGKLNPPEQLTAQVFEMTEAVFDALNAEARTKQLENLPTHEVVKIFYKELGLNFSSERLRHGFITEAANIALRGRQRTFQDKRTERERLEIDMKKAIQVFSDELILLDKMDLNTDIFLTGVLAGALIMLGLKKPIEDFLLCLNKGTGKEDGELSDPVFQLLKSIDRIKAKSYSSNPKHILDLCKKTIQAIESWSEGPESTKYWRKRELTGIDQMPYVHELKKIKNISDQMDL